MSDIVSYYKLCDCFFLYDGPVIRGVFNLSDINYVVELRGFWFDALEDSAGRSSHVLHPLSRLIALFLPLVIV